MFVVLGAVALTVGFGLGITLVVLFSGREDDLES